VPTLNVTQICFPDQVSYSCYATMSFHLPPPDNISAPNDDLEGSSASSENEDEETWDDWVSDSHTRQGCKSLFDEKILSSVEDAVAYDRESYKVDIIELCKRLGKFHIDILLVCTLLRPRGSKYI
jgi:type I protein arginine methyltransferase